MLCNHCHKNEAENRFLFHYMGQPGEFYICNECVERFQQVMTGILQGQTVPFGAQPPYGFTMTAGPDRRREDDPFPDNAGEEIKRRRRLSALQAQLNEAVRREDYERAAQLRDEITRMKQGKSVYTYDT